MEEYIKELSNNFSTIFLHFNVCDLLIGLKMYYKVLIHYVEVIEFNVELIDRRFWLQLAA